MTIDFADDKCSGSMCPGQKSKSPQNPHPDPWSETLIAANPKIMRRNSAVRKNVLFTLLEPNEIQGFKSIQAISVRTHWCKLRQIPSQVRSPARVLNSWDTLTDSRTLFSLFVIQKCDLLRLTVQLQQLHFLHFITFTHLNCIANTITDSAVYMTIWTHQKSRNFECTKGSSHFLNKFRYLWLKADDQFELPFLLRCCLEICPIFHGCPCDNVPKKFHMVIKRWVMLASTMRKFWG